MDGLTTTFEELSTGLLVGIGVLVLLQLTLMVAALVSVLRRPAESLRGPKWLWILVIIFGELVGPILYFALARKPEQVDIAPVAVAETPQRAESVADVLYGGAAQPASSAAPEAPGATAAAAPTPAAPAGETPPTAPSQDA